MSVPVNKLQLHRQQTATTTTDASNSFLLGVADNRFPFRRYIPATTACAKAADLVRELAETSGIVVESALLSLRLNTLFPAASNFYSFTNSTKLSGPRGAIQRTSLELHPRRESGETVLSRGKKTRTVTRCLSCMRRRRCVLLSRDASDTGRS